MERIRLFVGKIRIARIAGIARNHRNRRNRLKDALIASACHLDRSAAEILPPQEIFGAEWRDPEGVSSAMQLQGVLPHCQSQHGQAHGSFVSPMPFASVISTGAPRRFCLFKKSLARSGEIPRRYPPPWSFREFSPHCQSQHAWVLLTPAITRDYAAIPAIPAIP